VADVQVVINPDVKLHAGDSSSEDYDARMSLRAVFGMRLRAWPDGQPIRVFVLEDENPVHKQFAKTILSVFPYQLRRVWNKQVYSGTGQAPRQVGSEQEMREAVSGTPGAIGYLSTDQVDDSVRVLKVE
jgi:ABC-type phosphate transport system substrate-binding protein